MKLQVTETVVTDLKSQVKKIRMKGYAVIFLLFVLMYYLVRNWREPQMQFIQTNTKNFAVRNAFYSSPIYGKGLPETPPLPDQDYLQSLSSEVLRTLRISKVSWNQGKGIQAL